jgi:hypothetical protein
VSVVCECFIRVAVHVMSKPCGSVVGPLVSGCGWCLHPVNSSTAECVRVATWHATAAACLGGGEANVAGQASGFGWPFVEAVGISRAAVEVLGGQGLG